MKRSLVLAALLFAVAAAAPAAVEIQQTDGRFQLLVDGQPFYVDGVTYGTDVTEDTIDRDFQLLKKIGTAAIRTWGCGEDTPLILDTAERYGIKVMLGLWLSQGRPGAESDESFDYLNDREGMERQFNTQIGYVKQFKDHPALLMWGIGNEVILNTATDPEKIAYSRFLERVVSETKALDPDHPVASVSAWSIAWPWWTKYAPSIDIYGVNTYGGGAGAIMGEWEKHCPRNKPYLICEFGARGEWEAPLDDNGLKIEPSDQEKYDTIADGWGDWIKSSDKCLGGFVFNFDDKLNHTAVWLSLLIGDCYRPQFQATRKAFTGKDPGNLHPDIKRFLIPEDIGEAETWVPVDLEVHDWEGDDLNVRFMFNKRAGSREENGSVLPLDYRGSLQDGMEFKVPAREGVIKVYAFVEDSAKNLSIAQTSYFIGDPAGRTTDGAIMDVRTETPVEGVKLSFTDYVATEASSFEGAETDAAKAVDGDRTTRWASDHGTDPSWIVLEFRNSVEVCGVYLHWESASASKYRVQLSGDKASWSDAAVVTDGEQGERREIRITPTVAKYLRVLGEERTTQWGYSLFEIEVKRVLSEE